MDGRLEAPCVLRRLTNYRKHAPIIAASRKEMHFTDSTYVPRIVMNLL